MKKRLFSPLLLVYPALLVGLAIVGYVATDYEIRSQHHASQQQQKFATDLTFYDLPRINVKIDGSERQSGKVRMDISLEVSKEDLRRLDSYEPRIVNRVVNYMRQKDFDELTPATALRRLRRDLLSEVNLASSPIPIHDVVFRQFMIL